MGDLPILYHCKSVLPFAPISWLYPIFWAELGVFAGTGSGVCYRCPNTILHCFWCGWTCFEVLSVALYSIVQRPDTRSNQDWDSPSVRQQSPEAAFCLHRFCLSENIAWENESWVGIENFCEWGLWPFGAILWRENQTPSRSVLGDSQQLAVQSASCWVPDDESSRNRGLHKSAWRCYGIDCGSSFFPDNLQEILAAGFADRMVFLSKSHWNLPGLSVEIRRLRRYSKVLHFWLIWLFQCRLWCRDRFGAVPLMSLLPDRAYPVATYTSIGSGSLIDVCFCKAKVDQVHRCIYLMIQFSGPFRDLVPALQIPYRLSFYEAVLSVILTTLSGSTV